MLGNIEAISLLSTDKCHTHLPITLILICILLLHLTDLGMLASLDLTLVHKLIVVFLLILTSLFATFASFILLSIVVVVLLLGSLLAFLLVLSAILTTFSIRFLSCGKFSTFLTYLHDGDLLVFIERIDTCS